MKGVALICLLAQTWGCSSSKNCDAGACPDYFDVTIRSASGSPLDGRVPYTFEVTNSTWGDKTTCSSATAAGPLSCSSQAFNVKGDPVEGGSGLADFVVEVVLYDRSSNVTIRVTRSGVPSISKTFLANFNQSSGTCGLQCYHATDSMLLP